MKPPAYTEVQLRWIRRECPKYSIRELARRFNARFKTSKPESAIKACMTNHGIRNGRPGGFPTGTLRLFTKEQAAFIRQGYRKWSIEDVAAALNAKFATCFTAGQIRNFTRNHGILSGRTGCFEKGHWSWNAGTKGMGFTGRNPTSFKKGSIPPNRVPIGTERVIDGYVEVKIRERNPWTGGPTRFKAKHLVLWERRNGPLPKGCAIIFKDGNNRNFRATNLVCVTRAELLNLNRHKYSKVPAPIKPSVFLISKLDVRTRELARKTGGA